MPPKKAKKPASKDKKGTKDKKGAKEKKAKAPKDAAPSPDAGAAAAAAPPVDPKALYGAPVDEYTGRFLTHYDNTAGVPLPRTAVDQHIAMKHHVVDLVTAFKERYERLQHNLRTKLVPNKLRLDSLKEKLNKCSQEATHARERIEKITKSDCDEIISRLRQAEQRRQTAILNESNTVMRELEEIDRVFKEVQMAHTVAEHQNSLLYTPPATAAQTAVPPPAGVTGGAVSTSTIATPHVGPIGPNGAVLPPNPALMLHLIQQYPDLQSKIDHLAQRIPLIDTDFHTNDFPTEVSDRLAVISRCDKYAKAVTLKDEMLWVALSEKEKVEAKLEKEIAMNKDYCAEIGKWAQVLQEHVTQLHLLKKEKEKLSNENLKLKSLLRKHNIHYVDMTAPPLPPDPYATAVQ